MLAIANHKDPAKLRFNQSSMKARYNSCIEPKKFSEFESDGIDYETIYRFNKLNNKKVDN
jgi:hypothetical protein